ncbi:MAG: LON peptidase substrate-binding domain-containing protein [Planctomycetes bacterium]|nr:LON peptidase substrate-binding domain-containing protein [Planctomycetota bacterium]
MTAPPLDVEKVLREFSGEVPLFALPSLVLLPDVVAPLLIFEDRYRAMTADALEGERLVGMALLKPGWETAYEGNPPLYDHLCVGSIVSHEKLPDGRYKLLLYGAFRARVLEETQQVPYRRARVEVLRDTVAADRADELDERLHAVLDRMPGRRGRVGRLRMLATQVRGGGGGPGRLADAAAEAAELPPQDRYRVLAEGDVLARLDLILEALEARARRGDDELPPRADATLN